MPQNYQSNLHLLELKTSNRQTSKQQEVQFVLIWLVDISMSHVNKMAAPRPGELAMSMTHSWLFWHSWG